MKVEPGGGVFPVDTFVGERCVGNHHRVCLNPQFDSPEERQAWLDQAGEAITVLLFACRESVPRAEFYQTGRSIFRCGSGTLAAAHVLYRHLEMSHVRVLETVAGRVALKVEGELLGYGARGLAIRASREQALWQSLVDQRVLSSWLVGEEQDYVLLQLPDRQAVAQLQVDGQALSRSTGRALIVTARADLPDCDYVLRYFAPQYGRNEDSATGSAHLQVAEFWQRRLFKSRLRGRQLSEGGGEFVLNQTDRLTWVLGQTRLVRD